MLRGEQTFFKVSENSGKFFDTVNISEKSGNLLVKCLAQKIQAKVERG